MNTDPTLTRIGRAVELHHGQGRRAAARDLFAEIFQEIGLDRLDRQLAPGR